MRIARGSRLVLHGSALLGACVTVAAIFVPSALGGGLSSEAIACGGTSDTVQAEFTLDQGKNLWREFPAMLRAPELEDLATPVHVVVFQGDVDLSGLIAGPPGANPVVSNSICVVLANGETYFYDNVSRVGSRFR
jgi:hypothetical protein